MAINALEEELQIITRQKKVYLKLLENEKNQQKKQELIKKIDAASKHQKEILEQIIGEA